MLSQMIINKINNNIFMLKSLAECCPPWYAPCPANKKGQLMEPPFDNYAKNR